MTKLGKWPRRKLLNPLVKERKRESRRKEREGKGERRIEEAGGENEMMEDVPVVWMPLELLLLHQRQHLRQPTPAQRTMEL